MDEKGEQLNDEEKRNIRDEAFEQMYMNFTESTDEKENTRIRVKSSALVMKESLEYMTKAAINKD